MKKVYLMLMLMAAGFAAAAQNEVQQATEEPIYAKVAHEPRFRGGMDGLYQYLATNINYPDDAKEQKIEGRVIVSFIIEKNGSVSNVKTIESPDPLLSAEAERVVKAMPKWKPGRKHKCRKKVRVLYTLPINFQLNDK